MTRDLVQAMYKNRKPKEIVAGYEYTTAYSLGLGVAAHIYVSSLDKED